MRVGTIVRLSDGLPPELAIRIQPEKFVIELATETTKIAKALKETQQRIAELENKVKELEETIENTRDRLAELINGEG